MQLDMERFRDTFFEEAHEHLGTMENSLLQLDEQGSDPELLAGIFRAAHSIKGASGTFGFIAISRFTHVLENVLDRLRNGTLATSTALTRLLLQATDQLREVVTATQRNEPDSVSVTGTIDELEAVLRAGGGDAAAAHAPVHAAAAPVSSHRVRIAFEPTADFFLQGQDPLLLLNELAGHGRDVRVVCDRSRLPDLITLDPETCYLSWTVEMDTTSDERTLREVFMFVEDACRLEVTMAGGAAAPIAGGAEATAATAASPAARPPGEAVPAPAARSDRRAGADRRMESTSIRVPTEKVDALINLVGELVIAQAMVNQAVSVFPQAAQLDEVMAIVQRSTRDLQEQVMAIRMLPIGTVFNRFPRLVHDLGAKLGKRVRLDIEGADTELDKSVIEQLGDPLTHLIRNSIDHGIEDPEVRVAQGKPDEGTITLRAFHEGGNVVIEVRDDGKGLDVALIREKAVQQGLVREDAVLGDEEIHQLIFAAGFSTASVVSDVSGRGVGMDVVKRNVESLNGAITVHSETGRGSRIRIRLPLTLAILDGLTVRLGSDVFIVPLLSIRQSIRPKAAEVRTVLGGQSELFVLRGEQLPLVRLARLFQVPDAVEDVERGIVVVTETDGRRIGVLVDDVIGQQQVVVKSIESNYRRIEAVMGATILGDGRVAFILDVAELQRVTTRRRTVDEENGHPAAGAAEPERQEEMA
jgi:two-component system chemotaxis sensor kinase CheA